VPRTHSRLQGLGQLPGFIPSLAPQPDPQLVVWQQEVRLLQEGDMFAACHRLCLHPCLHLSCAQAGSASTAGQQLSSSSSSSCCTPS
jgi:hypothetical protein